MQRGSLSVFVALIIVAAVFVRFSFLIGSKKIQSHAYSYERCGEINYIYVPDK